MTSIATEYYRKNLTVFVNRSFTSKTHKHWTNDLWCQLTDSLMRSAADTFSMSERLCWVAKIAVRSTIGTSVLSFFCSFLHSSKELNKNCKAVLVKDFDLTLALVRVLLPCKLHIIVCKSRFHFIENKICAVNYWVQDEASNFTLIQFVKFS